ncbi:MAG: anthranilate synthase component I [Clostridiales bacterium]
MARFDNLSYMEKKCTYKTKGNIIVDRYSEKIELNSATESIINYIDKKRGVLLSSSYEYPNRYSRWDFGFVNPNIEIKTFRKEFEINSLNKRGNIILGAIYEKIKSNKEFIDMDKTDIGIKGRIIETNQYFDEENRSKQPTVFNLVREIKQLFFNEDENFLGLYGSFGYDLVFQFEPMEYKNNRDSDQADMILFLPDELIAVDHQLSVAFNIKYEFSVNGESTEGLPRENEDIRYDVNRGREVDIPKLKKGKYANVVREAIKSFEKGDLFEVVASQTLYERTDLNPSTIYKRLRKINPSPYGFIINLGSEFLVGSSPEMFIRVDKKRVETCPISGTIKRGSDAIDDAKQIKKLLNSYKDESELTMCTDVDRNDKSRICIPGSVKVIGRRQIEMYSHLIHTVDHVEGILKDEYDALDVFLSHMWAVTVTGAPKRAAIKWLEDKEDSARKWYGGAIGSLTFDGNLNTGLTLRTFRLKDGIAQIRVGATLLYDSIPEDEETETYIKAGALLKSISKEYSENSNYKKLDKVGGNKKILFVDHEDSFVHTLANYFKQTGAEVIVLRPPYAREKLKNEKFDLVMLSPGPGEPKEFDLKSTIKLCIEKNTPIFGVCLGLQGIIEYFGGELGQLNYPQHGKPSKINITKNCFMWDGIPKKLVVGRYHSLYAKIIPNDIDIIAKSDDGIAMAIKHKKLPITAVQFHPESILTMENNLGHRIIENVIASLK